MIFWSDNATLQDAQADARVLENLGWIVLAIFKRLPPTHDEFAWRVAFAKKRHAAAARQLAAAISGAPVPQA